MTNTLEKAIDALVGASADTIEKDVLYWLTGEDVDTLDEAINLLENVSCEAGDVNHLVYTSDCINWVLEHEEAIIDFLNANIDDEVDSLDNISWEQHNQINSIITGWESGDDRVTWFVDDYYEHAKENAREDNENWELMTEEEKEEAISEEIDYLVKLHEPLELTSSDKANLAWLTFEQTAWDLAEELEELKKVS